jgi:hypothetical protein
MNVRDLAPALIALAEAIREANHLTNPGEPDPVLNIEALREGSFAVDLILMDGGRSTARWIYSPAAGPLRRSIFQGSSGWCSVGLR